MTCPDGWKAIDANAFGSQGPLPVSDPQAQYRNWMDPKDPSNYGGFNDPASVKLADQASRAVDPNVRDELLAKADARLFDQMPWIPVVDVASVLYVNQKVTGAVPTSAYWWTPWAVGLGSSGS